MDLACYTDKQKNHKEYGIYKMITTGERQYGTLSEIRRDHLARYEFVTSQLTNDDLVIDAACGCGYGTYLMAQKAKHVIGYDNSKEAIDYAIKHYESPNSFFEQTDLPCVVPVNDIAVCFETIEHVKDPHALLRNLRESSTKLFASVPNQDRLPFRQEQFPFHRRHYTKQDFDKLLNETGWVVNQWYGQEDAYSEVEKDVNGRTLIVECI